MTISPNALTIFGAIFEAAKPEQELTRLEARTAAPDFWKDQADAQKVLQRRRRLEQDLDLIGSLRKKRDDLSVLLEWADAGEAVDAEFGDALEAFDQEVQAGEIKKMLGGEHDRKNAFITIHPGAGGTESQDWAEMLLRMYLRWTERRGFKREMIDYQPGDEAGLKSATVFVTGEYAYGLLSADAGVHRLVRISPFDQAARRHTSFASLYVWKCRKTSTWKSRRKTSASTRIDQAAPGDSTSTSPIRPSVSPTFQQALSCPARTNGRNTVIATRR